MFLGNLYALLPLVPLLALYCGVSFVKRKYRSWQRPVTRYAAELASSGMTGEALARRLLDTEGLGHVPVVRSAKISHYRPWRRQVCLNPGAFEGVSLPATAVAAHEVGHAQQFARGYFAARLWQLLWPTFIVLAVGGMALLLSDLGRQSPAYFGILGLMPAFVAVQVLMLSSVFLERDASCRAKKLVQEAGLITVG